MRLAVLVGAGLLLATAAAAAEVEAPRVSLSQIDWDAAAASLSDRGDGPPAAAFARLNTLSEKRFPGIAQSSVPALLPFDVEALDVGVAMNTGTQAAKEAGNMVDLDSNPTKLLEIVEIGKQLLMTRGSLTTFSIANDVAKYFAIIPAMFAGTFPVLNALNIMHLKTSQ